MMNRLKKYMWPAAAVLLAVTLIEIYITHRQIMFMMDDLWYSTMLSDSTPINSLKDIVVSQVWHYNNWGGRSMTHGMLQLTLLAGEQAADIINVLMTLALAGMICLVSGNRKLPAFFAALALPLGLNANWRESMFWQSGAANYLYSTVFILAFVFCYLRELPENDETEGSRRLRGITLWILPLGIMAGWSNENMGPAVWILSAVVIFLTLRAKRKVPLWMFSGSIACLFGSVMLLAAPGNFVRNARIADDRGLLWKTYLRSYSECKAALEYLFPVLLILVLILVLSKSVPEVRIGIQNTLLMVCALLSWGAMFLSPHYPDRASFGTMVLLICVIVSMAGRIVRKRVDLAWPLFGAAVLVWLRGMYFCAEYLGMCWGWI